MYALYIIINRNEPKRTAISDVSTFTVIIASVMYRHKGTARAMKCPGGLLVTTHAQQPLSCTRRLTGSGHQCPS